MKEELWSAANFLAHLVHLGLRKDVLKLEKKRERKKAKKKLEKKLDKFRLELLDGLRRRYRDHWFPNSPYKVRERDQRSGRNGDEREKIAPPPGFGLQVHPNQRQTGQDHLPGRREVRSE